MDDLLIVPLGIALAIRVIPHDLMIEFRNEANQRNTRPVRLKSAAKSTSLVSNGPCRNPSKAPEQTANWKPF